MNKKEKRKPVLKFLLRMIHMISRLAPLHFLMNIPVALLHSLSFVAITAANMELFNRAAFLSQGTGQVWSVMMGVGLLGLAYVFNLLFNGLHNYMYSVRSTELIGVFRDLLHKKASQAAPINYEDTEFLNRLEKARQGVTAGVFASDLVVTISTFYVPYFIFMAIFLGFLSPVLILVLLLVFLPVLIGQILKMKFFSDMEDAIAPVRRNMEYRERTICDRRYFKETRHLGTFGFMQRLYQDAMELMNVQRWQAERRAMLLMLAMKGLTILGYVGILWILLYLLLKGDILPGSFAAVFTSLSNMFSTAEEIISTHVGSVVQDAAGIRNLVAFLDMDENTGEDGSYQSNQGIVLDQVSFQYPSSDKKVLDNLSLRIAPGEVVAIVGENGAGKSTLVKILAGVYKPSSGRAYIGGLDSQQTNPAAIYQGISAVFQKYQQYKMTLKENITVSDARYEAHRIDGMFIEAMRKAEVQDNAETFPQGAKTMLSREFDGVDLSGGQWQRIAIARGLYRESTMMLLDEPTAAIDPLEESRLLEKFALIAKGKTTVIVTHRLGSTKIANRILVLKNGQIDDIGSHEELMARKGYYAKMYQSQAQWYHT